MGVDLDLLIVDQLREETVKGKHRWWGTVKTVLAMPGAGLMMDAVDKLYKSSDEIPDGHDIQGWGGQVIPDGEMEGELTYGLYTKDPYGKPYRWVTARRLAAVLRKTLHKHPSTAYVAALNPTTMIIFGWH